MVAQGYSIPEVEQSYSRAHELCQQVKETPQLFPVFSGLRTFYHIRADLQMSRELGEQFLSLAERTQAPALIVRGHRMLGILYSGSGSWLLHEQI